MLPSPWESSSRAIGGIPLVVLLADHREQHRHELAAMLDDPGSEFAVDQVATLGGVYERLETSALAYEAIMIPLDLPDGGAIEAIARIRTLAPAAAIVLVLGADEEHLADWLTSDVDGYFVRDEMSASLLARAIRQAISGHRLAGELSASERRCRTIFDAAADGMLVIDRDGSTLFANPAAERLFRSRRSRLLRLPFGVPMVPGERAEVDLPGDRVAEMRAVPIDWDGQVAYLVCLRDVTERHRSITQLREMTAELERANASLREAAVLDPLTSLINRRGLERALSTEMARARRSGSSTVAILVDCDDLKPINETLGHAVGDVVLVTLARRLQEAVRPTDHVARIGGDEFLLVLPDTRLAEALSLAERLRLAIAADPIILAPGHVKLTASFGVAAIPEGTTSIEEVLVQTRLALRKSKLSGKNRVSGGVDDEPMDEIAQVSGQLRREGLLRAVSHPIVDLADGNLVGWELLSRGPAGSFEMPSDFFRVAMEQGILTLVDLKCLKTCLQTSTEMSPTRFHVNLLPSTILDTPSDQLLALFPSTSSRASYCIEVSEQQLIGDPQALRRHLQPLRDQGVLIAVDDVGFGRSCLESLVVLEPDIVKIDRACVRGTGHDQGKARLLRRIVRIGAALRSDLVAEGIESEDDLRLVRDLGIRYGQGYLWGPPS